METVPLTCLMAYVRLASPYTIHGLWRSNVLFSIRIAHSLLLCPCLMSSLDIVQVCEFLYIASKCGFMFLAHFMLLHVYFCM